MAAEVPLASKVAFLSAPGSHGAERVEVVETHMSWVFLTDRFAYKLKKPLRQPLVDLRALAARRRNSLVEVAVNRRLAPDVYLGVRPLTFEPGRGLRLGPGGEPVEWLATMRRLPADLMLDRALRAAGPEGSDLDRVARRLARFYQGLDPDPVTPATRAAWFEHEIAASWETLTRPEFALARIRVERLVGPLRDLPRSRPTLFTDRHRAGGSSKVMATSGPSTSASNARRRSSTASNSAGRCVCSTRPTNWPSWLWNARWSASRTRVCGSSARMRRRPATGPPNSCSPGTQRCAP